MDQVELLQGELKFANLEKNACVADPVLLFSQILFSKVVFAQLVEHLVLQVFQVVRLVGFELDLANDRVLILTLLRSVVKAGELELEPEMVFYFTFEEIVEEFFFEDGLEVVACHQVDESVQADIVAVDECLHFASCCSKVGDLVIRQLAVVSLKVFKVKLTKLPHVLHARVLTERECFSVEARSEVEQNNEIWVKLPVVCN